MFRQEVRMIKMQTIKTIVRRVLAPVTIMFIPHHNTNRSLHLSIPAIGVFIFGILCGCGAVYLALATLDIIKYRGMERQLQDYSEKVSDFNATLTSLKKAERDLYRLLSLGSREKILENVESSDMGTVDVGTVDIRQIQQQIALSTQTIGAIQEYLRTERDIYMATPKGWPVPGWVTSPYGRRVNPISGNTELHRGMDISVPAGTPILATAEGIVSFSGWNGGGGNVVVMEHGNGYSTYYAHNKRNAVQVGQRIKRGEVIGHAGATGHATGSHVHYEIWRNGRVVNPWNYVQERS
jgi:murein DD-endopeptidase MepM/ murein hydrolase activator NlpD